MLRLTESSAAEPRSGFSVSVFGAQQWPSQGAAASWSVLFLDVVAVATGFTCPGHRDAMIVNRPLLSPINTYYE